MRLFKHNLLIFFCCMSICVTTVAQDTQNTEEPIEKKNILRYNLTPSLLGFKSYIIGYERILKPHQSFSVNVGYLALNPGEESEREGYNLLSSNTSSGFSIVADYRFYLKKENKFLAPRGVYLGPYYASYYLKSNMTVGNTDASTGDPSVDLDVKLHAQNLGIQLGYQFLFKNNISVDLVLIGPSMSNYDIKLKATGNLGLSDSEIDEAVVALKDIVLEKYPWVKNLFDSDGINSKGTFSKWALGYRYVIQVGYNF